MKKIIFLLLFFITTLTAGEKITDIKIEGLQRLDPGLVFNNIPFEIDDEINDINFSKSISLLYKTGQFKDVIIEKEGSVIIISVREKPILVNLNFFGTETYQPDALIKVLAQLNIASGLVLDESDLVKASKELESAYLSGGKYQATVKPEIIPLTNNRVDVNFYVTEGRLTRVKEVNIIGNKVFSYDDIVDLMNTKVTNYLSWWNKDDRYSKQILSGDLEKITSLYMDSGYLDFKILSSVVSISKNKKNVYISLTIDEGKKYKFGNVSLTGNFPEKISVDEVKKKILFSSGQTFSRKLVNESSNQINKFLGNYGYAFANTNAVPDVDSENMIVDFNFNIDQGKKIYVRRINISGNESSKDEVVRRELRQYESSWFSQDKVDLSKSRLNRLQYFESVNFETIMVPGTADQVDLKINLKETNTGKFQIGAGLSSSDGVVGTLSLSQSNFLGTGNFVKTDLSLGGVNKVWSLSFIDPYWTDDGVSKGYSVFYRDYDTKDLNIGDYATNNYGAGIDFGLPIDEFETIKLGATLDFTEINLQSTSPQKYLNYCSEISSPNSLSCDADSVLFYTSWTSNSVDNPLYPTTGRKVSVNLDISTPGLDLEYFKLTAKAEQFFKLSSSVSTKIKSTIGFADSYGDDPFPFYKNFRAGGKNTVRGFKEGSVGKKTYDANSGDWVTYGGKKLLTFGVETFFPVPFIKQSESYRLSAFVDAGSSFEDSVNSSDIRYSAGIGALWISPFGPLNISLAYPLNEGAHDQTEKFQFGMGSSF